MKKPLLLYTLLMLAGPSLLKAQDADTGYLDAVVINTDREAAKLKETVVSMSIIKPYLVQNRLSRNAAEVLTQAPGVSVTDGQINIRNGSGWSYGVGSRVTVTYDDIPLLNGDDGAVPFDYLPIENLSSVEIIKSAGSVLYGSSALNGVINLRSAPLQNGEYFQASLTAGQYQIPDLYQLRWSEKLPTFLGSQGYYSTRMGSATTKDKLRQHGLALMWNSLSDDGFRLNDHNRRARMGFQYEYIPKVAPLKFSLAGQAQTSERGSFLLWESYDKAYTTLDSTFLTSYNTRFNLDPRLEYNSRSGWNHKFINRLLSLQYESDNGDSLYELSTHTRQWYGEYKVRKRFFGEHMVFSAGAVMQLAGTDSKLYEGVRSSANRGIYSQINYRTGPWIAELGGRYEYYRLNQAEYQRPVFRAGVNRSLGEATFLRASAGQGFRLPSMAEMFTRTNFSSIGVFPNTDLVPEYGWNAELGLKQGLASANHALRGYADLSLFSMTLIDMMEFTFGQWDVPLPPTFGAGFRSQNVAPVRLNGAELELAGERRGAQGTWRLLGGYTYTDGRCLYPDSVFAIDKPGRKLSYANTRTDSSDVLKYRSRHMVRFDLQYQTKTWMLGGSVRYQSRFENYDLAFTQFPMNQIIPSPNDPNPVPFLRSSDIPDGYARYNQPWTFDVRASYQAGRNFKLQVQVSNLTNNLFMGRPCDLRPPRTVQAQVLYRLEKKPAAVKGERPLVDE
jgi:outer membrane receptor for ferrienterochelin and colicins